MQFNIKIRSFGPFLIAQIKEALRKSKSHAFLA